MSRGGGFPSVRHDRLRGRTALSDRGCAISTLKHDKFGGMRRSESPCPTRLTSAGEECSACDLKCMLVSAGGKRIAHIFHRGFWWCGMRVSDCENCGRGAQSNNRSERNNGRDPSEVSRVTSAAFYLDRARISLSLSLSLSTWISVIPLMSA